MTQPSPTPLKVAIIMGSSSDLPVMKAAAAVLEELNVSFEISVVSAHRTPEKMQEFGLQAKAAGFGVIIAGAGGAAHLPGMVASLTTLPVIGVPVALKHFDGLDSVLSILQMPKGVPVATVAVDNAHNAGLLAARILSVSDPKLSSALDEYRELQKKKVEEMNVKLHSDIG